MNQEKLKILEMIQEGKISAEEGLQLLQALEGTAKQENESKNGGLVKMFRVKVDGDKTKVNVKIPMKLVRVASKFASIGMNFIPEQARNEMTKSGIDLSQINFNELVDLIDQGLVDGQLVDVQVQDPQEGNMTVKVYVE